MVLVTAPAAVVLLAAAAAAAAAAASAASAQKGNATLIAFPSVAAEFTVDAVKFVSAVAASVQLLTFCFL